MYNGKKYDSGAVIVIDKYNCYDYKPYKIFATFLNYDTDTNIYSLKIGDNIETYHEKEFKQIFHGVQKGVYNNQNKELSFKKELEIDGLFLAWIWYVFIMAVAIIFNGRIGIWILTSIILDSCFLLHMNGLRNFIKGLIS